MSVGYNRGAGVKETILASDADLALVTPQIMRVPGWEQYPWLRAGFSTRFAGLSSVYGEGELNLGWTREDDPARVRQNREAFVRAIAGGAAMSLVTVGQVHGNESWDFERETAPPMTNDGKSRLEGDGLIARSEGKLLAILTADCAPVLVADTRQRAVGAFHAGWRGTLARIVERGVALMNERYGSKPEDLVAAIGPCIGACCFEVGSEVREAFVSEFPDAGELFSATSEAKFHMNLAEANRRQLLAAGIPSAAIWEARECTACARDEEGRRRYFSYRSERGVTGRMLSAIGMRG